MESKVKKIFTSKPFLFLLLLAVMWLALVLVKTFYKKHQLDSEIANLKKEIDKIDKKDQELSNLLNYFDNQNFLEKEAKEKLNMKKEGENVVIVSEVSGSPQPSAAPLAAASAPAQEQESGNLLKWWQYFFGN